MAKPTSKQLDLAKKLDIEVDEETTRLQLSEEIHQDLVARRKVMRELATPTIAEFIRSEGVRLGSVLQRTYGTKILIVGISEGPILWWRMPPNGAGQTKEVKFNPSQITLRAVYNPPSTHIHRGCVCTSTREYQPIDAYLNDLGVEVRDYIARHYPDDGSLIKNEYGTYWLIDHVKALIQQWRTEILSVRDAQEAERIARRAKEAQRLQTRKRHCVSCGEVYYPTEPTSSEPFCARHRKMSVVNLPLMRYCWMCGVHYNVQSPGCKPLVCARGCKIVRTILKDDE